MKRKSKKDEAIADVRKEELACGSQRKPYDSDAAAASRRREKAFRALISEASEAEFQEELRKYGLRPGSEDFKNALTVFRKLRGGGQ
jgi:hypothetical protein